MHSYDSFLNPKILEQFTGKNNTMQPSPSISVFTVQDFDNLVDTSKTTVSIGTGIKHDSNKPPMNLLSREALEQTAMVMGFGKEKYAAHNWRNGFAWSRPLSAAMRHLMAFNDGEDKDPESGLSHLAHAACCIMFLLEFEKTHQHLDDRFKPTEQ
jgi:hypothetical protein